MEVTAYTWTDGPTCSPSTDDHARAEGIQRKKNPDEEQHADQCGRSSTLPDDDARNTTSSRPQCPKLRRAVQSQKESRRRQRIRTWTSRTPGATTTATDQLTQTGSATDQRPKDLRTRRAAADDPETTDACQPDTCQPPTGRRPHEPAEPQAVGRRSRQRRASSHGEAPTTQIDYARHTT